MSQPLRCAIYARFSSDRQNASSAEDQERLCRERATREGWTVVAVHQDLAISGAVDRRPGMTAMLDQVAAGAYDIVLGEAIDRFGRDLGDLDRLYQTLTFAGVRFVTLADGDVGDLHIGLKGTMAKLELKNMGARVKRGQIGAISRGRVPSGMAYGYAQANILRADGGVERGHRRIDEGRAPVVRQIYTEILAGRSTHQVAVALNDQGVAAPRGARWRGSTIAQLVRNPIYAGRLCYDRVNGVRNPATRKRVNRDNAPENWIWHDASHLAIVDRPTWDAAQAKLAALARLPLHRRRRPKHVLSDLVTCGECGAPFTVVTSDRMACSAARFGGSCSNRRSVVRDRLARRVFEGLRDQLLAPSAVSRLVQQYHVGAQRAAKVNAAARGTLGARLDAVKRAIANLIDALELSGNGDDMAVVRQRLAERIAERDRLMSEMAEIEAPAVIALHPSIADAYRARVAQLTEDLDVAADSATGRALRALISTVTVRPSDAKRGVEVEVTGSLQAVLAMTGAAPNPPSGRPERTAMSGTAYQTAQHRAFRSFSV